MDTEPTQFGSAWLAVVCLDNELARLGLFIWPSRKGSSSHACSLQARASSFLLASQWLAGGRQAALRVTAKGQGQQATQRAMAWSSTRFSMNPAQAAEFVRSKLRNIWLNLAVETKQTKHYMTVRTEISTCRKTKFTCVNQFSKTPGGASRLWEWPCPSRTPSKTSCWFATVEDFAAG